MVSKSIETTMPSFGRPHSSNLKSLRLLMGAIALLLQGCLSSQDSSESPPLDVAYYESNHFSKIKEDFELKARSVNGNYDNLSNKEKAFLARNYLHNTVPLKKNSGVPFFDFWTNYYKSVTSPSYGHLCQGLAITYGSILRSIGVPVRFVGLFSKINNPDNHATTEVFVDGKWIISDATFNATYVDENGMELNYIELAERARQDLPFNWTSNGYPFARDKWGNERSPSNYYISEKDLMKYIVVFPATVELNGEPSVMYPKIFYPDQFEGTIFDWQGNQVSYPQDYSVWNLLSNY